MLTGAGSPIAASLGVVGLGLEAYGTIEESKIAKEEAGISQEILGYEQNINQQRQQLATDQYQNQTRQNFRQAQMSAARAKAASVNQGAQFSSGAQAGQQQATTEQDINQQGLYQNYQIGQNIFGLTSQINTAQSQLAGLQGQQATYSGIASLGGSIAGSAMSAGQIAST